MTRESLRANLPGGAIAMVLLVAFIEHYIGRHVFDYTDTLSDRWRYASAAARSDAASGADILVLGDSLMEYGVQPRVLQAATGRRAFNLASLGAPPSFSLMMLDRVLAAGGRPRSIVVDFFPIHLKATATSHTRQFAEFATPREVIDLAIAGRDSTFLGSLALQRILGSLRMRDEIRPSVWRSFSGEKFTWRFKHALHMAHYRDNLGAFVQQETAAPHKGAPGEAWRAMARLPFDPNDGENRVQETYFERLVERARQRGIEVVWLLPPMYSPLQQEHAHSGFDAYSATLARRLLRENSNLRVVDARSVHFDEPCFFPDKFHLNRRGAERLSALVAEQLTSARAVNPENRWLVLSEPALPSRRVQLDSLADTKEKMQRRYGVRR